MIIQSKDYLPPKSNSIYIYKGINNDTFTFKRYIEYINNDKIQIKFDNGINSFVNVYEYTPDGIKLCYYTGKSLYRQDFTTHTGCINNYLIKDPISKDNIWILSDGSKRCITNIDVKVQTQFKLYDSAIEVVTTAKNNSQFSINYYVLGIGLVKSIYYIKKKGFLFFELEDILEDTPYLKKIKFYYPDKNLNTIWSVEKPIIFNTNDDPSIVFSKEFESSPKGLLPLINRNTVINKMNYNLNNNSVSIDFSKDILLNLNNNSEYNTLFYYSIYNTLKDFYNTDNISISIEGMPIKKTFNISPLSHNLTIQNWKIENCKYPFTYVVKDNDTLIDISKKFNISYLKLAKLNNIENPNIINKHEVLQIYSSGIYLLKEGDSLKEIASMFGLSIEELIKINNISNLDVLKPGLKIRLS